ncbi:hypothetical protein [Novacetimonas hansenii]|uniref:hypothetical protein n=1 Tax=Novacetimonas hansenii TaxID=436 RepID=UPI000789B221|nr:hypothetical protein [Novacetimonas hansenii]RFP01322.1 hypothetical protein BGC30_12200 [Novacetimonas hansenii]WEQ60230.1 hypothetical protein LV563_07005 [Novacetimonas hansenii]CUW46414.1 hypothetical protein ATCC53582_00506 [Novacetimonas hansenii]
MAGGSLREKNIDGSVSPGLLSIGSVGAVAFCRAHDPLERHFRDMDSVRKRLAGARLLAAGWICAVERRVRVRASSRRPDVRTSHAHHCQAPWRNRALPASLGNVYPADAGASW